jgi:hypothetical protein
MRVPRCLDVAGAHLLPAVHLTPRRWPFESRPVGRSLALFVRHQPISVTLTVVSDCR